MDGLKIKVLAVSDNHYERQALEDIVTVYRGQVDTFLHLGDSEFLEDDPLWKTYQTVRGNNDYGTSFEEARLFHEGPARIFFCHGHLFRVNQSRDALAHAARETGSNIALYGHTHRPLVEEIGGIYCINPGSIARPRGPIKEKTFCILDFHANGLVEVQYFNDNFQVLEDLGATFKFNATP